MYEITTGLIDIAEIREWAGALAKRGALVTFISIRRHTRARHSPVDLKRIQPARFVVSPELTRKRI